MNLWDEVKHRLAQEVTAEGFHNWIQPTRFLRLEDGELWVSVPNEATQLWMEQEYGPVVDSILQRLGGTVQVRYQYGNSAPPPLSAVAPLDPATFNGTHLNPKHTFDTFVVGSSNQFAHAAAWNVAQAPAKAYNPLFLYGPTGMGKTHLIHAIAHHLAAQHRSLKIIYTTSERFMNHLIQSIKSDRLPLFHGHYRSADVLLVDDIQNLASKERTQEEFFHTFNELHEHGKQIVVSCDAPPKSTPGLVDRLRTRFEWGLMVDIQPPDLETKMAILDKKAETDGIDLPEDVRIFLATRTKSNVRELEGALVKLIAYASVTAERISLPMAQTVLKHLGQGSEKRITIESIIRAVAERYSLQPAQLKLKSNERKIANPRQIAMYLAKELTDASLPEIGRAFGGKHHTTVLHSVNKIEALRGKDPEMNKLLHTLSDSLSS